MYPMNGIDKRVSFNTNVVHRFPQEYSHKSGLTTRAQQRFSSQNASRVDRWISTMQKQTESSEIISQKHKSWIKRSMRGRELFLSAKHYRNDNSLLIRVFEKRSGVAYLRKFRLSDMLRIIRRTQIELPQHQNRGALLIDVDSLIKLVFRAIYSETNSTKGLFDNIDVDMSEEDEGSITLVVSSFDNRDLKFGFRLLMADFVHIEPSIPLLKPMDGLEVRLSQLESVVDELVHDIDIIKQQLNQAEARSAATSCDEIVNRGASSRYRIQRRSYHNDRQDKLHLRHGTRRLVKQSGSTDLDNEKCEMSYVDNDPIELIWRNKKF